MRCHNRTVMVSRFILVGWALLICATLDAQQIVGTLTRLVNESIRLEGFNGLNTYLIATTKTDAQGKFQLSYSKADYGVGYLISSDNKAFFVILSGEDIRLQGDALNAPESIRIQSGQQNMAFERYALDHPKREQAITAWVYLQNMYRSDSLFSAQINSSQFIAQEINRIREEDARFLRQLPANSYVSWFLPMRKLVSSASVVAQYRPAEIDSTIEAFRQIDYADSRLYQSGLLKDAIESHFWLIENSGRSLDSVFATMRGSIDRMMINLVTNEKTLNEVTNYLFDLLERHSLFSASEYLALKVLNEGACTIETNLARQLETYRAMKKGNIAPDLRFNVDLFAPGYPTNKQPTTLSALETDFTVVVFGASWCPKCTDEIPKIASNYAKWKAKGIEVVYVSLDETKDAFQRFVKPFPFVSVCDYKKWEGKMVKDYYVFGTPTMFLLDAKREILLRPSSVEQINAWIDWYLAKKQRDQ